MIHIKKFLLIVLIMSLISLISLPADDTAELQYQLPAEIGQDAGPFFNASFHYLRGKASVAVASMTIHREDWERTQTLKVWTRGEKESLFTIIAPARDRGNGTLKNDRNMWIFNPKVNRTIKLPPSMMSQAWMGSDFSNNDLAKSDTLVEDYTHTLVGLEEHEGKKVYVIESIPLPDAPVIWGKQIMKIRRDLIMLEESFYDEDGEMVKQLTFSDFRMVGNKLYPFILTMRPIDEPQNYTRVAYQTLEFRDNLPNSIFTKAALKNPPRD